jgi:hypothetical protein
MSDDLTLFGIPARVLVEIETRRGNRIQVPVTGSSVIFAHRDHGEIRIPFRGAWLGRLREELDDYELQTGDSA